MNDVNNKNFGFANEITLIIIDNFQKILFTESVCIYRLVIMIIFIITCFIDTIPYI